MLVPALALLLTTGLQRPVEASASPTDAAATEAEAEAEASAADVAIDPAIPAAAERGLAWLATQQAPRGSWRGDVGHKQGDSYYVLRSAEENERHDQGHIGVTALCGMAFLAGGHLPGRGEYGEIVQHTIDYILAHVGENGLIADGGTRMYSHAFATLFLAEVHGMTANDDRIRQGLERAVQIIVDCQNRQGGWRYNAFTKEADLSVTVCQLQALRAARNIGIQVPKNTIDEAVAFVKRARTPYGRSQGLFYYKNEGVRARTKNREYAINAAASTALYSAGVRDEELHAPVLDFLTEESRPAGAVVPDALLLLVRQLLRLPGLLPGRRRPLGELRAPHHQRPARDAARRRALGRPHRARRRILDRGGDADPRDPEPVPADLPAVSGFQR